MAADVARLEHAAVDGQWLGGAVHHAQSPGPSGLQIEHALGVAGLDEELECAAEGVVIGHVAHADGRTPLRTVPEQGLDAPVALLLVLAEHEACEQLRQREVLSAEFARVIGKDLLAQMMGP